MKRSNDRCRKEAAYVPFVQRTCFRVQSGVKTEDAVLQFLFLFLGENLGVPGTSLIMKI